MAGLPMPSLEHVERGGLPLLTDEALYEACGVRIAFTGRAGGVSEGACASLNTGANTDDDPRSVAANRRTVLDAIGAHALPLIVPKQVHETRVVRIDDYPDVGRASFEAAEGADAVQVAVPDVAAMLNFADCLPLILVAPSGRFAIVHAGWRGAVARIASKAVCSLAQCWEGEDPATFNAYIGPHIGLECFEVGEDVADTFEAEFGEEVVTEDRHVDLSLVVRCDLERAGLLPERIVDCDVCTVCHSDEYFSFRATDGVCGRQAAVAYRADASA